MSFILNRDYTTDVALGKVTGATSWGKFGYNEDIDTASAEVIAEFGGGMNYLTTSETLDIVSTSANDDIVGTGVRQVVIFGVDENWDTVTEVVDMDGTTTVTTSNSFIGVNRMTIFTSGSALSNVGYITASATTSTFAIASMPPGEGTTQQCIFYVPRDHTFLITWLYIAAIKSSGGGSPEVTFKSIVYSDDASAEFEIYRDTVDSSIENHVQLSPSEPIVIGEKSVIWIEAETSSNNTSVRARFSGKLISTP